MIYGHQTPIKFELMRQFDDVSCKVIQREEDEAIAEKGTRVVRGVLKAGEEDVGSVYAIISSTDREHGGGLPVQSSRLRQAWSKVLRRKKRHDLEKTFRFNKPRKA